jgi:hypothetical protein
VAEQDNKLVEQITQQVIAALGKGHVQHAAPAPIHPPIGTCTGDYSKFPELANKHIGGTAPQTLPVLTPIVAAVAAKPEPKPAPVAVATAEPQVSTGPVLTGIITAKQLETVHGSIVRLASSARLTPLALDFVKQRKLTVERVEVAGKSGGVNAASNHWMWWIDGNCPSVDQVTSELRGSIHALSTRRAFSALPEAIREVAKRVATNRAAGAILFVNSAAQAGCFANRCQSLRAVVGTSGEAVEEGLRFLAANVLILEYPHLGPKAMRAFVERFVTAERKNTADVLKLLKELGTCA